MKVRDHYARAAIKQEFSEDVEKDKISVDDKGLFVTPVVNYRYSVIWKQESDRIVVEAVVPGLFSPYKGGKLLDQVKEAVQHESNGYVVL